MNDFQIRSLYPVELAIDRAKATRDRGVRWILSKISGSGKPVDAEVRNGWSRVPWALIGAGEIETATKVISWVENSGQFNEQGDFTDNTEQPVGLWRWYWLAHYAHGAWLSGNYSLSVRTMKTIARVQDEYGGIPIHIQEDLSYTDLLSTSQAGITAILTGEDDIANSVYLWIKNMWEQQPYIKEGILYLLCIEDRLVIDVPQGREFIGFVDYSKPKQAYFNSGIAAAFMAAYSQKTGDDKAIELAEKFLLLNAKGTEQQFEDKSSVQICKYGWGLAELLLAQPDKKEYWLDDLVRMVHWFSDWQKDDGSWGPSSFLTPEPGDVDKLGKTAEHVMELNIMIASLGRIISTTNERDLSEVVK